MIRNIHLLLGVSFAVAVTLANASIFDSPDARKALGRVKELEVDLRRHLRALVPDEVATLRVPQYSKTGALEKAANFLSSVVGGGPVLESRPGVLRPRTERLHESIDMTSAKRVVLNQLHFWKSHKHAEQVSCTPGPMGSRDFNSLPLCPNFTPCGAQGKNPDSGLVAACSAGFSDPVGYFRPSPPRNCESWHKMDGQDKLALLRPYLTADMTASIATSLLLLDKPQLGCAQRRDFVPQSPVGFSVYQLKNVYVDSEAAVFNRTTMFLRLGCRDGVHYSLPPQFSAGAWEVRKVGAVVNWAYRQGHNFYHSLVESFPLFLSLGPLMNKNRDLPFLGLKHQFEMYGNLLEPLVGVPLDNLKRYEMRVTDLFHGEIVYQPVYQNCGRQSRGMWTELRQRHLLHPEGIPLFNPDWSMRHTTPLRKEEMARIPDDWVVVLGQRPGMERSVVQAEELLKAVKGMLPPERIVVFTGDLSILEARNLFRRARLFIAGHGAALANMIFMPTGSSLLELRPREYENNCFHSLADACQLKYHLLIGEGSKGSRLSIDVDRVATLVRQILHQW